MKQSDCIYSFGRFIVLVTVSLANILSGCSQSGHSEDVQTPANGGAVQMSPEGAWRSGYESIIRLLEHTQVTGLEEWKAANAFSDWDARESNSPHGGEGVRYFRFYGGGLIGMLEISGDGRILGLANNVAMYADAPGYDEEGNILSRPAERYRPEWSAAKAVRLGREALEVAGIEIPSDYDLTRCRYGESVLAWDVTWQRTYSNGRISSPAKPWPLKLNPAINILMCEKHGVLDIRTSPGVDGDVSDLDLAVTREQAAVKAGAVVPNLLRDELNPWLGFDYAFWGVQRVDLVARIPTWDFDPKRSLLITGADPEPPRLAWAVEMAAGFPSDAPDILKVARPSIQVFVDAVTGEIIGMQYEPGSGR